MCDLGHLDVEYVKRGDSNDNVCCVNASQFEIDFKSGDISIVPCSCLSKTSQINASQNQTGNNVSYPTQVTHLEGITGLSVSMGPADNGAIPERRLPEPNESSPPSQKAEKEESSSKINKKSVKIIMCEKNDPSNIEKKSDVKKPFRSKPPCEKKQKNKTKRTKRIKNFLTCKKEPTELKKFKENKKLKECSERTETDDDGSTSILKKLSYLSSASKLLNDIQKSSVYPCYFNEEKDCRKIYVGKRIRLLKEDSYCNSDYDDDEIEICRPRREVSQKCVTIGSNGLISLLFEAFKQWDDAKKKVEAKEAEERDAAVAKEAAAKAKEQMVTCEQMRQLLQPFSCRKTLLTCNCGMCLRQRQTLACGVPGCVNCSRMYSLGCTAARGFPDLGCQDCTRPAEGCSSFRDDRCPVCMQVPCACAPTYPPLVISPPQPPCGGYTKCNRRKCKRCRKGFFYDPATNCLTCGPPFKGKGNNCSPPGCGPSCPSNTWTTVSRTTCVPNCPYRDIYFPNPCPRCSLLQNSVTSIKSEIMGVFPTKGVQWEDLGSRGTSPYLKAYDPATGRWYGPKDACGQPPAVPSVTGVQGGLPGTTVGYYVAANPRGMDYGGPLEQGLEDGNRGSYSPEGLGFRGPNPAEGLGFRGPNPAEGLGFRGPYIQEEAFYPPMGGSSCSPFPPPNPYYPGYYPEDPYMDGMMYPDMMYPGMMYPDMYYPPYPPSNMYGYNQPGMGDPYYGYPQWYEDDCSIWDRFKEYIGMDPVSVYERRRRTAMKRMMDRYNRRMRRYNKNMALEQGYWTGRNNNCRYEVPAYFTSEQNDKPFPDSERNDKIHFTTEQKDTPFSNKEQTDE